MHTRKNVMALFTCYVLWGFQPLYWALLSHLDSFLILFCRIVMAAVFSVLILGFTHRLSELKALFQNRDMMKILLPATVFLLADWAIFIVVINAGHVLDASLGYYVTPLVLFAISVVVYKERCTKVQLLSLGIAAIGVIISTVAFGSFPWIALIIAVNWAVYTALKKKVQIDGVLSIAAETLILTPLSIAFLAIFRHSEMACLGGREIILLIGSGIVTALPMFLYSNSVTKFPLIVMCFAQYLGPTFNLICGLIRHERFSPSQIVSFAFFILAIVVFTASEIKTMKKSGKTNAQP